MARVDSQTQARQKAGLSSVVPRSDGLIEISVGDVGQGKSSWAGLLIGVPPIVIGLVIYAGVRREVNRSDDGGEHTYYYDYHLLIVLPDRPPLRFSRFTCNENRPTQQSRALKDVEWARGVYSRIVFGIRQ